MPEERTVVELRTTTPEGRPCHYPDTAILTQEEAAAVLGCSLRKLRELPIASCPLSGDGMVRYLYRDLVAYLVQRRRSA